MNCSVCQSFCICSLVYAVHGQHAAVFGICTEKLFIYRSRSTCAHGACMHRPTSPVSGEGGGGQVILKRANNPRRIVRILG